MSWTIINILISFDGRHWSATRNIDWTTQWWCFSSFFQVKSFSVRKHQNIKKNASATDIISPKTYIITPQISVISQSLLMVYPLSMFVQHSPAPSVSSAESRLLIRLSLTQGSAAYSRRHRVGRYREWNLNWRRTLLTSHCASPCSYTLSLSSCRVI